MRPAGGLGCGCDASTAPRIPELDGLRGVAIALVVLAHYFGEVQHGIRWLALGWVGVDLFFVLSGYLIGGILLRGADLRAFYLRRACRIFPVYYLAMLVVGAPWWYFAYAQNVVMAWTGAAPPLWLLPTWTLCVEEQFYLLLPWLLLATPRRHLTAVLVGLILMAPALRWALGGSLAAYVLLPCRWDLLLIGVLAAHLGSPPRADRACLAGLALAVTAGAMGERAFQVAGILGIGIAFGAFVLMVANGAREGRRFRRRALRYLGRISYCLYLVHQPVAWGLHRALLGGAPDIGSPAQLGVTLLSLGTSLAIAALSWRFLEGPLVEFGRRCWARWPQQRESCSTTGDADSISSRSGHSSPLRLQHRIS